MKTDNLLKLLAPSAPSGFECAIAEVIEGLLKDFADEVRRDNLGNLIVYKKGKSDKKLMCAAHMDQIGFIVTDIDEKGFLRVANLGGINSPNSVAQHVVFANGKQGALFCEVDRDGKPIEMKHLFIDVGASSKEEAEKTAKIGDWAVYAPRVAMMGNRVASPYMDDRAGCAMLVDAFLQAKDFANDVYAVFTVQEELGLRGATTAAWQIEPDMGIALDVTPAGDAPKAIRQSMKLGDGPCVKVMDRSLVCHLQVRAHMEAIAEEKGIPYQREVLMMGGTDAGAIHVSRAGVRTGAISIPCRYVHSAAETIDIDDYTNGVKLLASIMERDLP